LAVVLSLLLSSCASGFGILVEDWFNVDENCPEADLFPELEAAEENGEYPAPDVFVYCTRDEVVTQSNDIPGYEYIATTPNGLAAQHEIWRHPRHAARTGESTTLPLFDSIAYTFNGVPIYGPNEGEVPDPYGDPVYNDILDYCLGHTGVRADYHYHALFTECVLRGLTEDGTASSPQLGFALDGFPIYGPYCCEDQACSAVRWVESSWVMTGDPSTYAWDAYEYQAKLDAAYLDECNGHTGPRGDYHYHRTDTFPYVLGCFSGTATLQE
jgi:hypothetical protein